MFSWDRKENDNSIYDNNDKDTCNSKKKIPVIILLRFLDAE